MSTSHKEFTPVIDSVDVADSKPIDNPESSLDKVNSVDKVPISVAKPIPVYNPTPVEVAVKYGLIVKISKQASNMIDARGKLLVFRSK